MRSSEFVQPSITRKILALLSDQELREAIEASGDLREAVRSQAGLRQQVSIGLNEFRKWLAFPRQSDRLLKSLFEMYSRESEKRTRDGDPFPGCVGTIAFCAFDAVSRQKPTDVVEACREELERIRAEHAVTENEAAEVEGGSAVMEPSQVRQLASKAREISSTVVEALIAAADMVEKGLPTPGLAHTVATWDTTANTIATAWALVRTQTDESERELAQVDLLAALDATTERLIAEEESAASANEARRAELTAQLDKQSAKLAMITAIIAGDDEADNHLFKAVTVIETRIAEIELELGFDQPPARPAERVAEDSLVPEGTAASKETTAPEDLIEPVQSVKGEAFERSILDDEVRDKQSIGDLVVGDVGKAEQAQEAPSARSVEPEPVAHFAAVSGPKPAVETVKPPKSVVTPKPVVEQSAPESPLPADEPDGRSSDTPDSTGGLIATAISRGDWAGAYWIGVAAGLDPVSVDTLSIAAGAFNSGSGAINATDVLVTAATSLAEWPELPSSQFARIALASMVRASLAAGWVQFAELDSLLSSSRLDTGWQLLVDTALQAATKRYVHSGLNDEVPTRAEVAARAARLRNEATGSRISYTRADKVLKFLLRETEILGGTLSAIESDNTTDRHSNLARLSHALSDTEALINAADVRVNTAQQRRNVIESQAKISLRQKIQAVADCVAAAIEAETYSGSGHQESDTQHFLSLLSSASAATEGLKEGLPGDAAMLQLRSWIQAPAQRPPTKAQNFSDLSARRILTLADVPRTSDGSPIFGSLSADDVARMLAAPVDTARVVEKLAKKGDLAAAAALTTGDRALEDALEIRRIDWTSTLQLQVKAAQGQLARTAAQVDMTLNDYAAFEAEVVAAGRSTDDRFDLREVELNELLERLKAQEDLKSESLARDLKAIEASASDNQRVERLIADRDLIGARELIATLKSVGRLPNLRSNGDLPDLFQRFLAVLANASRFDGYEPRKIAEALSVGKKNAADAELSRLDNWATLRQFESPRFLRVREPLAAALRLIGLDLQSSNDVSNRGARHYRAFTVTARPIDGSLVPALGSQAMHYDVVVVFDQRQIVPLLQSRTFADARGANILLYAGLLPLETRRRCLTIAREHAQGVLVVDYLSAAFLAVNSPSSFKSTQRIGLPFTNFQHYSTVAGNVPDEVFVGRNTELSDIQARDGSLFVYGGRQLGKSALLRKVQREFNASPTNIAIYVDLLAHGIGTWSGREKLWDVLFGELRSYNLTPKGITSAGKEKIVSYIKMWLDDHPSRRMLLLLDESDAFLEKESRNAFSNVLPLKQLMDASSKRFKTVFAGLHQVQRLQNVANTPLAHGGDDILIGPLSPDAALDLVVRPLNALGYVFEKPESVWRLLAFTNNQASLIQIVCTDLLAQVQSRRPRNSEPPIVISNSDIDTVISSKQTREKIANKFRLTINLEDRYTVIAQVVALLSMNDEYREQYGADVIRDWCESFWREGFSDLTTQAFAFYLQEMVGLGVLVADSERYAVRSPNIVSMLGTQESIERELDEGSSRFDLPQEYNARVTRRIVRQGRRQFHSPLTEHDLGELLAVQSKIPRNFVVIGSPALEIDRVEPTLVSVSHDRDLQLKIMENTSDTALTGLTFQSGVTDVAVINCHGAEAPEVTRVLRTLEGLPRRRRGIVIVIVGPSAVRPALDTGLHSSTVLTLERWSGDGIRSWSENPLSAREHRDPLVRHSGGWPELVEKAVADVQDNEQVSTVWTYLQSFPQSALEGNRFLTDVGARPYLDLLERWNLLSSPDDEEGLADLALVLDEALDDFEATVRELVTLSIVEERSRGYAINQVVSRALMTK